MSYYVYMLLCADGSYYTGLTNDLVSRLAEHEIGSDPYAYTFSRRPVRLVWSQEFSTHEEAFTSERQIKGWSRKKKEALIRGDWDLIHQIVMDKRKRREKQKRDL